MVDTEYSFLGNGERVDPREMEALPTGSELLAWEEGQLGRSAEEIWADKVIPSKIKRKLVLEKLGYELDPHFFVPGEKVNGCMTALMLKLRRVRAGGKQAIGVSTASMSDRLTGEMPALRIKAEMGVAEVQTAVAGYQSRVNELCGGDWSQLMLHVYSNPWEDPKRVAGARYRVQTLVNGSADAVDTPDVLEIIAGKWPRALNESTPGVGHYHRSRGSVENNLIFGPIVVSREWVEMMPSGVTTEELGLIELALRRIDNNLRGADERARLRALQNVLRTPDVTIEMCWLLNSLNRESLYTYDFDADLPVE